jgi:probable rRNA maturation factor
VSAGAVDVQYAHRKPWSPSRARIDTWARAALGRQRGRGELSVRIVGAAESRRLNRLYRGKDKPTNVLSFPPEWEKTQNGTVPFSVFQKRGQSAFSFGDLVVCAPVVAREARLQRKPRDAHWAHMIVHGTLHLLGYDHEREDDAARMEQREISILRRLGFANPYSTPSPGASRERAGVRAAKARAKARG